MTNGDLLRQMNNEELAAVLMCPNEMGMGEIQCNLSDECDCYRCLCKWLNKPVENKKP